MSENKNKTPLEEALNNFEEIKKFAQEQAAQALESKVEETLKEFFDKKLNEDTTINIDSVGNVEITTDGEIVNPEGETTADTDSVDLSVDSETELDSEDEFEVSDDEDEIEVSEAEWLPETMITSEENIQNQNMEEINRMMEDEVAPATPAPATAAPAAEVPAEPAAEAPVGAETAPAAPATVEDIIPKLDTLINLMMQQVGGAAPEVGTQPGAEAGTNQEFEVIDDEAGASPAAPAAPTAEAPANPMEEEIEIVDFEGNDFIDEMEEQMLEIDGIENEDEEMVDETRGLGFAAIRSGQRNITMDTMNKNGGHHSSGPNPLNTGSNSIEKPTMNAKMPNVSIKENKAQNESKLDELKKENNSLKNEIASLKTERKDFETAFSKLRTQFNEMQLFNGKLVLLNKVLKNGGLKQEEKIRVCEQFDSAKTYEDASKLFKNIMKESNVKVDNSGLEKLKAAGTNTAKPKSTSESLYESAEAKRNRQLAGIGKSEEEN